MQYYVCNRFSEDFQQKNDTQHRTSDFTEGQISEGVILIIYSLFLFLLPAPGATGLI